jgi:hypothetical protein
MEEFPDFFAEVDASFVSSTASLVWEGFSSWTPTCKDIGIIVLVPGANVEDDSAAGVFVMFEAYEVA